MAKSKPKSKRKLKFSVLLLYPEHISDGRAETYFAWVEAKDAETAVVLARKKMHKDNPVYDWDDFEDAENIGTFKGHKKCY